MTPVKYVNIPAQYSLLREEILQKLDAAMQAGDFILGSELKQFERDFAKYCDSKHSLGVANGTDALILTIKALGIGHGSEVITAPNSFLATAASVIAAGAQPVFADVGDDYNIDPNKIEKAITGKTKAIIPVHLTGRPASMKAILDIARKHNLFVIEDSAQAVGALLNGKKTGSFGIAGCFSFHPLKTLNAYGDGGAITTSDEGLYENLVKLRNHGLKNRDECDFWGYNSRLDNIQAAILNVKLKHLDGWNKRKREIAAAYRENLEGISGIIRLPADARGEEAVYHTFVIQCENRDGLQKHLLAQGIETKIHYPIPIHLQKAAASLGYKAGDFPKAETQARTILSLPIYPELPDSDIDFVCNEIRAFYASRQPQQSFK